MASKGFYKDLFLEGLYEDYRRLLQGFFTRFHIFFLQGFYEAFPRDLRRNGLRRLLPDFCSVSKRVFTMCLQGFPHASLRGVHDALTRCLRKVLTRFLRHVHKALVAFSQGAQSVFTKHIQRVYKTFIMFLEGVR